MDFGEILGKAWKIIWKFKILWLFGILSSCGQGGGGGGGSSSNTGYKVSGGNGDIPPEMQRFFGGIGHFFDTVETWQIVAIIGGLILFFLILWFIMTALSTIGRVGLIQGTVKAEEGAETLTFGELFKSGKPFFWRILGLNLLLGFAIFLIIMLLMLPLIGVTVLTMGIGIMCLIPFICILVPAMWLAGVIIEQANIAVVVEDLGIMDGLKRGWTVCRENIGNMIVMALILVLGGGIVGMIIALPLILIIVPVMIGVVGGLVAESEAIIGGGLLTAGLCFVAYLPVLIVLGGILRAYISAAWTLTYLRLTAGLSTLEPIGSLPEDI
ncbi:MAG: hypothetical protein KJ638_04185 [Chloroflexi bacterium]|nr:hypothetical protein [Chloroflexota bacterium]